LSMRPTSRLLHGILVWIAIGIAASFWAQFVVLWWGLGALLAALSGIDFILAKSSKRIDIERRIPGHLALNVDDEILLTLHNRGHLIAHLSVFDGLPEEAHAPDIPWTGTVQSKGFTTVAYPIRMRKRGRSALGSIHVLHQSPFGLWQRRYLTDHQDEIRVYPNYEPVVRYALLAMENRENQMGIVMKHRRGASLNFHQLRDYQEGDNLSQIDWKATSKRLQLISREYREERDQNIILMVDCGRRMRALDGELSQFDHCLNSILLLSFIALRQSDHVGVLSFGGTDRWLPPVKGQHAMTTLLNHLYDYETGPQTSDFAEAAERLMMRQRRRALVILLTNLRSEDIANILPPLQLMKRRHLPLIASLRESTTEGALKYPVTTFEDALSHSATQRYVEERTQTFEQIRSHGILTLDDTAANLPTALTNRYLEIKDAGLL